MFAGLNALSRLVTGRSLAVLFALCFTPLVLFIALMAPPGETPDEPTQIARAGSLLRGQLLGRQRIDTERIGTPIVDSGVTAFWAPTLVCFGIQALYKTGHMTAAIHDQLAAIPWDRKPTFVSAPNVAPYFPVFFVPMSVGLGLGKALGLSPFGAVLSARVVSGLAFIALGTAALLVARYARAMLFATLTLPMSLWLGATCNQDGVMLAAVCLAAALLTAARVPTDRCFIGAGLLLACLVAVKPPYAPLLLAMLVPLDLADRAVRRRAAVAVAVALLPALLWTPVAQHYASGLFIRGPSYVAGPLWPGPPGTVFVAPNAAAQLSVFIHNPLRLLTIPVFSILAEWQWKLFDMLGVLAALTLLLPKLYYQFLLFGLLTVGLSQLTAGPGDLAQGRHWKGALTLAAAVAALFLVYDAQYLSWSEVGHRLVEGVQGRYFLPLLPFVGIGLAQLAIRNGLPRLGLLNLPFIAIALFGTAYIPALVVSKFYL